MIRPSTYSKLLINSLRCSTPTKLMTRSQISLSPTGTPSMTGPRAHSPRGTHLFHLLASISNLLPEPVKITVSDHDMGNWLLSEPLLEAAKRAVSKGRYLDTVELTALEKKDKGSVKGILGACSRTSPGWAAGLRQQRGVTTKATNAGQLDLPYVPDCEMCR